MDAIGITLGGDVVIIELKATAVTLSHHRHIYHVAASHTSLRNGLPDTEAVHHNLQAGFGAFAAKHTFPALAEFRRVRACILVSCKDACELYWVPERYYARRLFDVAAQRQVSVPVLNRPARARSLQSKKTVPKVIMSPWPTAAPGLRAALPRFGYAPNIDLCAGALAELTPLSRSDTGGLAVVLTRGWHTLGPSTQTAIESYLTSQCSRVSLKTTARRAAGLVIYPCKHGSWGVTRVCMIAVAANVV